MSPRIRSKVALERLLRNRCFATLTKLEDRTLPAFIMPPSYPVAQNPNALVTGDFNTDGIQDIAVTNRTYNPMDGRVSVLLGVGDGSFQNPMIFNAGKGPTAITVGEFNGDGLLDLAVTEEVDEGTVRILLGKGNGKFRATRILHPVGPKPASIAVADFNSDGKLDIVTGHRHWTHEQNPFSNVSVLLGKGNATFEPAIFVDAGVAPRGVAVGDFDGDSDIDIAASGYDWYYSVWDIPVTVNHKVQVLLGNGDGSFVAGAEYSGGLSKAAVAADLDADGDLDLVTANGGYANWDDFDGGNTLSVRLGNGDGTFQSASEYEVGPIPRQLAVADLTHDGNLDLLSASIRDGTVSVLAGIGDGTFIEAQTYIGGENASAVAVADFDGDGRRDVAVTNQTNPGAVTILLGNPNGGLAGIFVHATPYTSKVELADFDNDGHLDIASSSKNSVNVQLGNGDGTFRRHKASSTESDWSNDIAIGDFNLDGILDIARTNYNPGSLSILLGNGDGTFEVKVTYPIAFSLHAVEVGDFNGDGTPDIVAATSNPSGDIYIFLGNGDGTFHFTPSFTVATGSIGKIAVGDFNSDNIADLAISHTKLIVLFGVGDGTFNAGPAFSFGLSNVVAADLNGDGRLDLAGGQGDDVAVLKGNGDGTFQSPVKYSAGGNAGNLSVSDFNQDGTLDILLVNSGWQDDTVSVLLGTGGAFAAPLSFFLGNPSDAAPGDFNEDGYPDVAVATGGVAVLFNDGIWAPTPLPNGPDVSELAVLITADTSPRRIRRR